MSRSNCDTTSETSPANDNIAERSNGLAASNNAGARTTGGARRKRFPKIHTDLPDELPILEAEIDLIQAWLSDIIGSVIANDNDQ